MAIDSTTARSTFAGNGSTTAFSFPYYFQVKADLKVILKDNTTGVETLKTLTTHYTISGTTTNGVYEDGGTVTMLVAPASGETLIIYTDPALTQGVDLANNDSLPAETIEQAFDKLTMIAQRQSDRIDRSVRLSDGFAAAFDLELPADLDDSAGRVMTMNEDGDGFAPVADWPLTTDINAASANATAAAASAAAADASADAAAASQSAAAASESAADASADAAALSAIAAAASVTSPSLDDGTESAPSLKFTSDTNTGLYRLGADEIGVTAGAYAGIRVKKSTGSFANVGMGGSPSASDAFPLLIERSNSAGLNVQVSNPEGSAAASVKVRLMGDIGSGAGLELAYHPAAQAAVDAYTNRGVIRPVDAAAGLSVTAGDQATGDIKMYAGGYGAADETLRVNADQTLTFPNAASSVVAPSTAGQVKLYVKSDGKLYRYANGGSETEIGGPVTLPTVQRFTSGSGTYTTPAGVRWIRVRLAGGGGGGAGSSNSSFDGGNGGTGGNTTFGSSLLNANGGVGATKSSGGGVAGPAGGSVGVSAPAVTLVAIQGAPGAGSGNTSTSTEVNGGTGGNSPFGGAGQSQGAGAGTAAIANTGSGGGGGGTPTAANNCYGGSGASGGFVDAIIFPTASQTFAYAIGAAGTAGAAGTGGYAGGAGGSGIVIVEEYY